MTIDAAIIGNIIIALLAFAGSVITVRLTTKTKVAELQKQLEQNLWTRVKVELDAAYAEISKLKDELKTAEQTIEHLRVKLQEKDAEITALTKENKELLERLLAVEKKTGTGPLKGKDK